MGRGDPTVPVVESWTALSMAAGATSRIHVGSFVANVMNRHPAVVARMASTLQIASGGRLRLGIGIGGHPAEHEAYGIDFPPAARARGAGRGGGGGHPGAVDGRPDHAGLAVLPALGRVGVPGARPAATDHRRWRDGRRVPDWQAGSATGGRRSTTTSRRTCRSTSSRSRHRGAGARTSGSSSASRATGLVTRRSPGARGSPQPARDVGALEGRPARTERSSSPARRPTWTVWSTRSSAGRSVPWHHPRCERPDDDAAARGDPRPSPTHACVRCGAPVAIDVGPVRAVQSAWAARLVGVAGPRDRHRRRDAGDRAAGDLRPAGGQRGRAVRGVRIGCR